MPIIGRQFNKTTAIPVRKTRVSVSPSHRPTGTDRLTKLEDELYALILKAFDNVPKNAYMTVIRDRDGLEYQSIVYDALSKEQDKIAEVILKQLETSGTLEAIDLSKMLSEQYKYLLGKADKPSPTQIAASFRFDLQSKEALAYARTQSSQLITNMAMEQRAVMRQVVGQTMSNSATRGQTSSALRQILQDISPGTEYGKITAAQIGANTNGLTRGYEKAVWNRANSIAEDLTKRGITGTKAVEELKNKTDKYAEKLRKARARTIARTEMITSAEQGRQQSWDQAAKKGLIDKNKATKTWSASPMDVCKICSKLQGKTVKFDGKWDTGIGSVKTPPAHPNCRCTMILNSSKTPPRTVGTGAPSDPFRLEFDSSVPNIDNFPSLPSPDIVTPPKPTPTPKPPAVQPVEIPVVPTVEAPLPAPARIGGQLSPESFDDLRPAIDDLDTGVSIQRVRDRPKGKTIFERQSAPTAIGDKALDALEEAGRRIDVRIDEILAQQGIRSSAEMKTELDLLIAQRGALVEKASELRQPFYFEVADRAGIPMTDSERQLISDPVKRQIQRENHAQRIAEEYRTAAGKFIAESPASMSYTDASRAFFEEWISVGNRRTIFRNMTSAVDMRTSAIREALEFQADLLDVGIDLTNIERQISNAMNALDNSVWKEREALRQALREARANYGTARLQVVKIHSGSKAELSKEAIETSIAKASADLPAEWVETVSQEQYTIRTSQRGYHQTSPRVIATSGGTRSDATMLHEITHAVESHTRRLSQANDAFYARASRNGEEQIRRLKTVTGGNYSADELAIEDDFGDWYAGKWYGGSDNWKQTWPTGSFETLTRGMESLFRQDVMNKPFAVQGSYRRFLIGSLVMI